MISTKFLRGRWLAAIAHVAIAAEPVTEWPEFRGPTGQGLALANDPPVEWSTTRNVAWRSPVPGQGWSSPVVSQGRVFLTTAVSAGSGVSLRLLALDAADGKLVWNTEVFTPAESSRQAIHGKNSQASPTPIIAGDRIYVHFGHHGTAALDRAGKVVWRNRELSYESEHGNGPSPVLVGDRLIFIADASESPFVVALDAATGAVKWRVARPILTRQTFSFATPLLIEVKGRPQLISPAAGAVFALDPQDGRELWRVTYGTGWSVVPRPVFGHGLVFVATGFMRADLLAIRVDGAGDVTDSHLAWRTTRGAPLTPSVLLVGDELYAVNDAGIASCWDARTGKVHWQERIDGNYSASPVAAGGRIYFQNETGVGTVLKAGTTFAKLATNKLEEPTLASPAVVGNALFSRTEQYLYRIGTDGATKGAK